MNAGSKPTTSAKAYLTLHIGGQEYGIDILRVQEIRSYVSPTSIANAPPFLKGVIDLRGVIVPIVDLRIRLGCEAMYNTFTVVIVLNIKGRAIGIAVDSVSEVADLSPDQARALEGYPHSDQLTYVRAVATVNRGEGECSIECPIMLMDIEGLLCDPAMGLIGSA